MDISLCIRELLGKMRSRKLDIMDNIFSGISRSHGATLDLCLKM